MKKLLFAMLALIFALPNFSKAQGCMDSSPSTGGPQIIGYIQPEFRADFLNTDKDNTLNKYSFAFRRARIGLTGSIPYDFSYYVMTDFSSFQNGPYLLDAFVTYNRFKPWFKLSIGQFKRSFGLELSTPCQDLYTIDRSLMVSEMLTPFRDLGVMISGSTADKKLFGLNNENIIAYSLSLTNGTGMNVFDKDRYKDITARLVLSPVEGIAVGGSYQYGKLLSTDTSKTADLRTRIGADISVKKKNFVFQAEYIKGVDDGSKLEGGGCGATPTVVLGTFKRDGYYAQLGYMTKWNIMPLVKFESYDPDKDLDDIDTHAYRKSTVIMGLNYYPNDATRVQMNYFYNIEKSSSTDIARYNEYPNDAFVLQVQVKLN